MTEQGIPIGLKEQQIVVAELRAAHTAENWRKLYALIDASRDPAVMAISLEAMTRHCECLYRGKAYEDYGSHAPWLAELRSDEDVLDWILDEHFGKAHVSFFVSVLDLHALAGHFRRFVKVRGERHDLVFYRFFDPFILNYHLPIFSTEQRQYFLGPISTVFAELGEHTRFKLELVGDQDIAFERINLRDEHVDKLSGEAGARITNVTEANAHREFGRYAPPTFDLTGSATRPILSFSADQHAEMRNAARERSRFKIIDILKEAEPREAFRMSDSDLYRLVLRSEKTGSELGIRSESGQARWAYLMGLSRGHIAEMPEATDFIRSAGDTPDNRVRELLLESAAALRNGTAIPPVLK